jgi:prepilin signal peptidase PulO-like enzyme (type II secretory pathway)
VWLTVLTGLIALAVYDLRWYLLPDRIVFPLTVLGLLFVVLLAADEGIREMGGALAGALIVSGLFYGLFQFSKGKWIGGGDVKLGVLVGLLSRSVMGAFLLLFIASVAGTLYSLVAATISRKHITRTTRLPFGPFLILGAFVMLLFGDSIIAWYTGILLPQ